MAKIIGKTIQSEDVRRIVLSTLMVTGLLAMAVMAPNAIQALTMFTGKKKRHWTPYYATSVIQRLKKQGYVEFEKNERGTFVRLTQKGKNELLRYKIKEKFFKQKRWDKCWRVVAFDIKEKKKETRNSVRRELQNFGFIKLQNSVWVFPYDCEDVIALLKAEYEIGKEVLYIVAKHIENDQALRKHFELE